jgi:hypothetical protein
VSREREAKSRATAGQAIDALWMLTVEELHRGDLRALLAQGLEHHSGTRAASAANVEHLFASMSLTLRAPTPLLADASGAFANGLALAHGASVDERGASFDLSWLALLSLGE